MEFKIEIWIHAIFICDNQQKLITENLESTVYKSIKQAFNNNSCTVNTIGGDSQHVHILFQMNPEISLDELLKKVKLSSQMQINHQKFKKPTFFWESGYYAFSIGTEDLEKEKHYIISQKNMHKEISLPEELKKLREDYGLEEDDDLTDISENSFN